MKPGGCKHDTIVIPQGLIGLKTLSHQRLLTEEEEEAGSPMGLTSFTCSAVLSSFSCPTTDVFAIEVAGVPTQLLMIVLGFLIQFMLLTFSR